MTNTSQTGIALEKRFSEHNTATDSCYKSFPFDSDKQQWKRLQNRGNIIEMKGIFPNSSLPCWGEKFHPYFLSGTEESCIWLGTQLQCLVIPADPSEGHLKSL